MSDRDDYADLATILADPGAVLPRHHASAERLYCWQARAILAAGWVPAERHLGSVLSHVAAERDALAATVERVRALCDEVERVGRKPDWSISTARIRRALAAEPSP